MLGPTLGKQPERINAPIRAAKTDSAPHVRSQAIFWLAQKAGRKAEATIVNAIQNDPDTEVKKKAVFALSQLPKGDGVPKLIEVARSQKNPQARKQTFDGVPNRLYIDPIVRMTEPVPMSRMFRRHDCPGQSRSASSLHHGLRTEMISGKTTDGAYACKLNVLHARFVRDTLLERVHDGRANGPAEE